MKNRKPFTQDKGFVVDERNKYVCKEKKVYLYEINIYIYLYECVHLQDK